MKSSCFQVHWSLTEPRNSKKPKCMYKLFLLFSGLKHDLIRCVASSIPRSTFNYDKMPPKAVFPSDPPVVATKVEPFPGKESDNDDDPISNYAPVNGDERVRASLRINMRRRQREDEAEHAVMLFKHRAADEIQRLEGLILGYVDEKGILGKELRILLARLAVLLEMVTQCRSEISGVRAKIRELHKKDDAACGQLMVTGEFETEADLVAAVDAKNKGRPFRKAVPGGAAASA